MYDKTANNISFICERFYVTTLLKESGAIGIPGKTYKLISNYNKNILINSTVNKTKRHFSVPIPENMKVLPTPD